MNFVLMLNYLQNAAFIDIIEKKANITPAETICEVLNASRSNIMPKKRTFKITYGRSIFFSFTSLI